MINYLNDGYNFQAEADFVRVHKVCIDEARSAIYSTIMISAV